MHSVNVFALCCILCSQSQMPSSLIESMYEGHLRTDLPNKFAVFGLNMLYSDSNCGPPSMSYTCITCV